MGVMKQTDWIYLVVIVPPSPPVGKDHLKGTFGPPSSLTSVAAAPGNIYLSGRKTF